MLQPLVDGGMGGRLADQDEAQPQGQQFAAERLMAVEVVAEDGGLEPGQRRAVGGQPALSGIDLAVLLRRAVPRRDELRGQRDDLVAAGLDPHRGQGGMAIGGLAVGVPPCRAALAVDRRRGEIHRPVEGEQQRAVDGTEGIHHARLLQGVEQEGVQRLQRGRRRGVKQGAEGVVRRDFMDAEQRPGMVVAVCLLQAARVFQERGAVREEHREGAQRRVDHRVGRVPALAGVNETLEGAAHLPRDAVQGQGVGAKRCAHQWDSGQVWPATLTG